MAFRIICAAFLLQALLLASPAAADHLPRAVADTLNFALNLECLEAQFYSCAVFGKIVYGFIQLAFAIFFSSITLICDCLILWLS